MNSTSSSARTVQRLRLRATSAERARHAALLLEDALRTATLPGTGRFILFRRLALGRLDPGKSASSFALAIERAVRQAESQAVRAALPAAAHAAAVVFQDRFEAVALLARRIAQHQPADEWFWPAALPGWRSDLAGARWTVLLEIAHSLFPPLFAAVAVLAEAVAANELTSLMRSLPMNIGTQWLRAVGFAELSLDPDTTPNSAPPLPVECSWVQPILSWVNALPRIDHNAVWLACCAAVRTNACCATDLNLPQRAYDWLRESTKAVRKSIVHVSAADEATSDKQAEQLELRGRGCVGRKAKSPAQLERTALNARPIHSSNGREGEATAGGGLFFLIPVLQQLGIASFLQARPHLTEQRFGPALLRQLASRVKLPESDPICSLLDEHADDWPERMESPRCVQEILAEPRRPIQLPAPFGPWITAARRWCRRRARIGLHSLIHRPAQLFASQTHWDVCFRLDQIDFRIRRAGLDLDPGWVAWLGQVVRFHYLDAYDR